MEKNNGSMSDSSNALYDDSLQRQREVGCESGDIQRGERQDRKYVQSYGKSRSECGECSKKRFRKNSSDGGGKAGGDGTVYYLYGRRLSRQEL